MQRIQFEIAEFCRKLDLKAETISRLLDLISELGELAKEFLKTTDYGERKDIIKTPDLEMEFGDIFFSLICLANNMDIDLEIALENALNKYKERISTSGRMSSK